MRIFAFIVRSIALTMALTGCAGLNPEVISKDVELLEEVNEDVVEFMHNEPIEKKPETKKKSFQNPKMHDKVINLNYVVAKKSTLALV